MAGSARQLNGQMQIVTPENIAFEYRLAGPFCRLPAYAIDVLIQWVLLIAITLTAIFGFGFVGLIGPGIGVTLVAWFVISWFYGGLFETFWNGQTPGKWMLRLRVVTVDGQPINALQAVLRNVLRVADSLPPFFLPGGFPVPCYLVGLFSCLLSDRYQRLGDLACGTIVIIEERQRLRGVARLDPQQIAGLLPLLPPAFVVSRSLARALAKYVERRGYFPAARRADIARHLGRALIEKWDLPPEIDHDLLLCALYHRTFITDRRADADAGPPPRAAAPPAEGGLALTGTPHWRRG